jgi:hypothetical protein
MVKKAMKIKRVKQSGCGPLSKEVGRGLDLFNGTPLAGYQTV